MTKPTIDVEDDGGEKRGDRIGRAGALGWLDGHVDLLLDDRRADRGEADDERDDLQMLRLAEERRTLRAG